MLEAKKLGHSLKEVSVEHLQSSQFDLVHCWFHSDKEIDLYIWKDEKGAILKQQLCFLGVVAEWSLVEGAKTGDLDIDRSAGSVRGSTLIGFHTEASELILEQAVQISKWIEALKPADRDQCCQNWKRQP